MKATYVKTNIQSIINVSKIVTIHYYEFDKNFVFLGESHDFWEMVYVDKGKVEISRDGEIVNLSQGEIIFHRPNEFHTIKALDSAPNFFVLSFVSNSPAMQYFEKYHTTLDKTLTPFISSIIKESEQTYVIPKNDPSLKKLVKREDFSVGGEQLIKTYLEQLLILSVRKILKKGNTEVFPSKQSMENHLVTAVKAKIEDSVFAPLSVPDICSSFGYSKSYLSKLFKEQTGATISSYSVKIRIQKAKLLIRDGKMNFTQISDKLCFDNPQYFSQVFKRVTGMTPSEFKFSLNFKE